MQVNETQSEGLKRQLTVTVPASDLDARLSTRLEELKGRMRINGFRPGKVPTNHLRKVYGKAAMAEIVEGVVTETSQKALSDREERPAMRPAIAMTEDEGEAEEILAGKADLTFTMDYEVLPDFEVQDVSGLKVKRPIAEVSDEEVDERLDRIAEGSRPYETVERKAKEGDRLSIAYVGKIDGEAFEGGSDENGQIVLGSGRFIPGFEEQLTGVKAGEERQIEVSFPEDYPAAQLAGKQAMFDVSVKEVAEPGETQFDDEFAKKLGIESMDKLRQTVREQIESEYGAATRQKVKRQILDRLDEMHDFPLPENLVEQEFESIWRQVTHDIEHHGKSFEDEGTTEEDARKEYRAIAERRVRLGLVLSKIGEAAEVQVTDDELQRALYERVRQFPGQEQQVYEFYRSNPDALMGLRAPIFEEKTVDHILGNADVEDEIVSKDDLLADDEDDLDIDHSHDHDH